MTMLLSPVAIETGGRPLFVVSDLHLGKPSPFGFPAALEGTLADALDDAADRHAIVVLNGDILESGAAVTPFAALARYPRLLAAFAAAAARCHLYYVIGNHDPSARLLERVLPWTLATSLLVDRSLLIIHGDALDHGLDRTVAGRSHRAHGVVQEALGVRLDLPLRHHSSLRNRLVVGALGALGSSARRVHPALRASIDESFDYLVSLEQENDPRFVLATLAEAVLPRGVTAVLAGHTHHPGIAEVGSLTYYNSGTWSEHLATAIHWSLGEGRVVDVLRGTTFGREVYARWQDRESWTSWWSRARTDLAPGRVLATAMSERFGEPRPLALPPPPEETSMTVTFDEILRGTLRRAKGPDVDVRVELRGSARAGVLRTRTVEVEGTFDAIGFAAKRPVYGALEISLQGLEYELSFVADDGRPYRFVGQKRVRVFDLTASLSHLAGDLIDPLGRVIAQLDLRFDVQRDLGPFVRSLALVKSEAESVARRSEPVVDPWRWEPSEAARGAWVAVTGAAGHVGNTITRQLIDRGYSVLALVRNANDARAAALRSIGADVVMADILSPASLREALEGRSLFGMIHTAAEFKLWSRDAQRDIIEPTVSGTLNVLRAAEHVGARRVVYTSAGGAAGHDATGREPLTEEDWNATPHSPYLRAKLEAEQQAWSFAKTRGIDLVSILPTAIIGPYFHSHTPVTRLLEDVFRNRYIALPQFAHSWVDVRDVGRAHILALEAESAHGRYIASARYESWHALVGRLQRHEPGVRIPHRLPSSMNGILPTIDDLRARLLGSERVLTRDIIAELEKQEPRYSSRRIERELGWTTIDFDRTVSDTVRWMNRAPAAEAS